MFRSSLADLLRALHAAQVNRDGNVAVEFALVMPIMILMIVGIADYGLAFRERSSLDAAARAGLQVLLKSPTNTSGAEVMAEALVPAASAAATLTCTCSDGATVSCASGTCGIGAPRQVATVTVTETYSLLLAWPGFENPRALSATALGRLK